MITKSLILFYHSIARTEMDPFRLHVSPRYFEAQLKILKRYFHPISLAELVESLETGKVPKRAVVLTFDDGYANNLTHALPLLEKYRIPATVFVVSGKVDSNREFWWDELEQLFLLPPYRMPDGLFDMEEFRSLRYLTHSHPQPSYSLYFGVWGKLKQLDCGHRERLLSSLFSQAGKNIILRNTHRPLTLEELPELARSPYICIGAHTASHPPLADLQREEQEKEILKSKKFLEKTLSGKIDFFSYPFGSFTPVTSGLVEKAGFLAAVTTEGGKVSRQPGLLRLPRHVVGNWTAARFLLMLSKWFLVG